MTKIDIISGFLGAGKTTLIKKLLKEAFTGEQVVLIENEFGEIGIDGGFLKDSGIQIKEMNSGCICCSLVGDFGESLKEVLEKYSPDRIIIEPSGVGKLSDVIAAVNNVASESNVRVNSYTTVVDIKKCKMFMKNFGEFFNNQIESAHTIVLSRTQNIAEEKTMEAIELIKEHNANAVIITTPWEQIDGKQILEAMEKKSSFEEDLMADTKVCPECGHVHDEHEHHHHDEEECGCKHHHDDDEHHHHDKEECGCKHHHDNDEHHHHDKEECGCKHHHDDEHHHHDGEECGCGHHHHHADEVFTSWGIETPKKFDKDKMNEILKNLSESTEYGVILRAKGIVPAADGTWIYFDLVPGEYELRDGAADIIGRLCVIGSELNTNKLEVLFGIK